MMQLERIKQASDLLESVYEEMLQGYVDDGMMQEAVDTQITVNRIVFRLNEVYYGADFGERKDD